MKLGAIVLSHFLDHPILKGVRPYILIVDSAFNLDVILTYTRSVYVTCFEPFLATTLMIGIFSSLTSMNLPEKVS